MEANRSVPLSSHTLVQLTHCYSQTGCKFCTHFQVRSHHSSTRVPLFTTLVYCLYYILMCPHNCMTWTGDACECECTQCFSKVLSASANSATDKILPGWQIYLLFHSRINYPLQQTAHVRTYLWLSNMYNYIHTVHSYMHRHDATSPHIELLTHCIHIPSQTSIVKYICHTLPLHVLKYSPTLFPFQMQSSWKWMEAGKATSANLGTTATCRCTWKTAIHWKGENS